MTPQEAAVVLGKCAAFDNRRPDPATVAAWAEALDPDVTLADALTIVTAHYAESRDWIMPADINRLSRDIRRQRVAKVLETHTLTPEGLEDEPHMEIAWRKHAIRALSDGATLAEAKTCAWQAIHRQPPTVEARPRPLKLPHLQQP